MKRVASLALAGLLAASTVAVSFSDAEAHRRGHRHHHHHSHSSSIGPGLAAGLIFGLTASALSHSYAPRAYYPPPVRYVPVPAPLPAATAHSQWCAANFPSYDYRTNTIVDAYGVQRPCFSPY